MMVIELRFPAGRYHATPWGRNVNEGEAEWPPSPYRLARAIVDAWKRRRPHWSKGRIEPILKGIGSSPVFSLPPASAAHTRSFLSINKKNPTEKRLVFDPFVAVGRTSKILIGFNCDLTSDSLRDLDSLITEFNYLGRSESWVEAKLVRDAMDIKWNCVPVSSNLPVPRGDTVRVACLLQQEPYDDLPIRDKLPQWLESVCFTTKDLLTDGWSDPPALLWRDYIRPPIGVESSASLRARPFRAQFRFAKFALSSKVLPRVQETVSFAERIRVYLMGIHKRIRGNDPSLVSPLFSGKGPDGSPLEGHRHSFYVPLDEDGDGCIDHLIVYAGEAFDESELRALDALRSVWQPDGRPDIDLILVSLSAEPIGIQSMKWVSATPFVTSRHYRKGRGTYEEWLSTEIARECAFHGLPSPVAVEWISRTVNARRPIRWMEFVRSRKGEAPLRGHGCVLTFERPVTGPFALGSRCHFGLGLFVPHREGWKARTPS